MTPSFGARLGDAIARHGRLCVGIDPHPPLLRAWDLPDDARGVREFGLRTVAALADHVAALKPQVAFFERHGSAGIAALEEVIAAARAAHVLTIVDAKRGDIGSTMQGYADAFCREGSPLAGDAVTLSPYLGFGSLRPAIDTAAAHGRGVFVLALTSNPEGAQVQHARPVGAGAGAAPASVAAAVAAGAAGCNALELGPRTGPRDERLGSVGLVVGATIGDAAAATGTDLAAVRGPLLAPGIGAQGGDAGALRAVVGAAWHQVLPTSSREVLGAGPDPDALRAAAAAAIAAIESADVAHDDQGR